MDLPVEASWPDDSTLARLDYRSKKALTGPVRIVTIPGIDVCACCGTHVEHTGAVGLIKILSVTRLRGGVRVEYAAGRRAYHYLDTVQQQNRMISAVLSARPLHTAEAVRRLLEERDAARKRCVALEQKRFEVLAQQQSGQGDTLSLIHIFAERKGNLTLVIGLDVGSTTIKCVVLSDADQIV